MAADDLSCGSGLTDAGYSVQDDPGLTSHGWVRRFMASPERAREATELYEGMGFEVKVVELTRADFGPNCAECGSSLCQSYVLIYTRKASS
jgi:hypothetical protein